MLTLVDRPVKTVGVTSGMYHINRQTQELSIVKMGGRRKAVVEVRPGVFWVDGETFKGFGRACQYARDLIA
jgi:hypothetical protein